MGIDFDRHKDFPESILIRKFGGIIQVEDIIASWEYLIENKMLVDPVKAVVNDISSCDLNMDMTSFKKLMAYLKQYELFKKIKLAVICDDPRTIVFPVFGSISETELSIRPFTTMDAAVEWIMKN